LGEENITGQKNTKGKIRLKEERMGEKVHRMRRNSRQTA
jgi:hypothetical protein